MNETKRGPIDGAFLFIAEKFDGRKTLTGIMLIIGGATTLVFTPEYKEAAISMIASGLPMLIVGLVHKTIKKSG